MASTSCALPCVYARNGRYVVLHRRSLRWTKLHELQTLGEHVLMQCVHIRTHLQLKAFKTRLLDGTYVDGKPTGHLVQDFMVMEDETATSDVDAAAEDVMFVVTQTSKLQSFRVMLKANHALLSCLSAISASTLTKLETIIPPDDDGIFPVINSLHNLRMLLLYVTHGEWTHSAARPISLPRLNQVYWACQCDDIRFLIFLSNCKFGDGRDLALELNARRDLQADSAHLLFPLFSDNTFRHVKLSIPSQALSLLVPSIVSTTELVLHDFMPAPGVFSVLPEFLTLLYPSAKKQDQEAFWNFLARPLAALSVEEQRSRSTVNIIYEKVDQAGFDWLGHRDADYVVFIGRLLKIAVELYQHNIIVEDVHGRNVTSLTQQI
jgi:hypothetical protein